MMRFGKSEMIKVLEGCIEQLKDDKIPEEINVYHVIDKGGWGDDMYEIYDFDLGFDYDEEDNVLILSYLGDENPGTPDMP